VDDRTRRLKSLAVGLVLLGLNLLALNYLLAGWSGARIDLTEDGEFSVSPATRRLVTGLDEEVSIIGYFSERTHPKLAPLVPQITDLLEEYRTVSRGRVHVEWIDPGHDEEAEQEAADRFGVQSTPFRLASKYEAAIVNAYFALVVRYGDQYVRYGFEDLIQVDPTPDGDIDVRLRNLEYDLTRAIKKVVYGFRGAGELFERLDRPVKLTAIWTPRTLPELFAHVPEALNKAAEELRVAGGERFVFEALDPSGDERLQNELYQRFGAQPMSLGLFDDQSFYLYALLDVDGKLEQIPLARESLTAASIREAVENALRRHAPGFLKTVGIVSSEPPEIPPQLRMQMGMPPAPPPEFEEVKSILGQDYRVRDVDLSAPDGVPSEVDILLVLQPKDLTTDQVYGLDQYLMRGGRIVLCGGRFDADFSPNGLNVVPVQSGLEGFLAHHGVTITPALVLDDRNQPLPVPQLRSTPFGTMRTWALAPYPYLVQVREDGFVNPEITSSLDSVGIYWGSPITIDEARAAGLKVVPILQSSPRSWTDEDPAGVTRIDYAVPAEGTGRQLLAVALSGKFKSYFRDRRTTVDAAAPAAAPEEPDDAGAARPGVTLQESPETRLVIVSNAEFLSDFVARALAAVDGSFFVENLRFAQNLIDWTSLDNDMLDIRARGVASRRLERVDRRGEAFFETLNYGLPVLFLAVLGSALYWRRRHAAPVRSEES